MEDSGFMPIIKSAESSISRLAEFQSFNPTLIESEATDPKFNEIANKAQIGMGTGDYVQEYIVADDLHRVRQAEREVEGSQNRTGLLIWRNQQVQP